MSGRPPRWIAGKDMDGRARREDASLPWCPSGPHALTHSLHLDDLLCCSPLGNISTYFTRRAGQSRQVERESGMLSSTFMHITTYNAKHPLKAGA